jgi:hypothetical protein
MNLPQRILLAALAACLLCVLPSAARADSLTLVAWLEGTNEEPEAYGLARYGEDSGIRTLFVDVEQVASVDRVYVQVNGVVVGEIDIDANDGGILALNSKIGIVPEMHEDDEIEVVDPGAGPRSCATCFHSPA